MQLSKHSRPPGWWNSTAAEQQDGPGSFQSSVIILYRVHGLLKLAKLQIPVGRAESNVRALNSLTKLFGLAYHQKWLERVGQSPVSSSAKRESVREIRNHPPARVARSDLHHIVGDEVTRL